MDGNGRWAKRRGLPRTEGHRRGAKVVEKLVKRVIELQIPFCTFYCFSKENWSREKTEVDFLINLLKDFLVKQEKHIKDNNARFKAIGKVTDFSEEIQDLIKKAEDNTKDSTGPTFIFALSYSGRDEIINSVENAKEITEEGISENMYCDESGDVDLMIRTSGEERLSGFLLWQCSYAEFIFEQCCWPDFSSTVFDKCLFTYSQRRRRFGKEKAE
ncbi:hypothetical protein PCE1_001801 [Barthelona sp. PCE]